jgi:hypothetical protein
MFKWVLVSLVIVPVLLGVQAATSRRGPRGLMLLALVLAYDAAYLLVLYFLRYRWVG